LLQYKYLNGEVYTFYKKIPRKKWKNFIRIGFIIKRNR
jgi:hypothetical protein